MTAAALARRRNYHVGNVRGQLLAAARELLETQGIDALSLRAIAVRAGVAPGTVYYHYADKAALMAGLAVDGFRQLTEAMRTAYAERGESSGLRSTGDAFLGFIRDKPALYQLMYEARDAGRRPEVAEAEAEAIAVSRDAIMADYSEVYPQEVARTVAEAIWAWGRGIAAVSLAKGASVEASEEAVRSAVRGLEALVSRR